jgi:para-nitrobenzyl esterase|tara:strand:+ start:71 stop:337 length:267 start_codon:yes stop_codon:yes gene_type:complete
VIFWIHGGGLIQDSANLYDGTALARNNDIVVVSINYRLSIFGFLDVSRWGPEYAGSANRGYEDQIAALARATRTLRVRMGKNYNLLSL